MNKRPLYLCKDCRRSLVFAPQARPSIPIKYNATLRFKQFLLFLFLVRKRNSRSDGWEMFSCQVDVLHAHLIFLCLCAARIFPRRILEKKFYPWFVSGEGEKEGALSHTLRRGGKLKILGACVHNVSMRQKNLINFEKTVLVFSLSWWCTMCIICIKRSADHKDAPVAGTKIPRV